MVRSMVALLFIGPRLAGMLRSHGGLQTRSILCGELDPYPLFYDNNFSRRSHSRDHELTKDLEYCRAECEDVRMTADDRDERQQTIDYYDTIARTYDERLDG